MLRIRVPEVSWYLLRIREETGDAHSISWLWPEEVLSRWKIDFRMPDSLRLASEYSVGPPPKAGRTETIPGPGSAVRSQVNGRHVGTRTPDLYRVKFEVNNLKPFSCLAFPCWLSCKIAHKQPSFGDELVTSFRCCAGRKQI